MRLEVELHSGVHSGAPSPDTPLVIVQRHNHIEHNGLALWEIVLTLKIRGPESWWKQARKYFTEVVWLRNRPELEEADRRLEPADFEEPIPISILEHLNRLAESGNREALRLQLPDSFIRTGLAHTTMAAIAQIDAERHHYNAGHWLEFCEDIHEIPEIQAILGRTPTD